LPATAGETSRPTSLHPANCCAEELSLHLKVILFDVGGVLVELGGVQWVLDRMGPHATTDALWPVWLRSPSVRAFERGHIDSQAFATGIIAELGIESAPEEFLLSFAAWPTRAYPGALEMVASIPPRYQRALLSNSNVLHWPRVLDEMSLGDMFEHRFSSHLMGKIKPDDEAFHHVMQSLGCDAAEVLFLDDNLLNVDAARRLGMQAVQVRGIAQTRTALQQAGVLP
jgi:glucose-1-phosphatase